MSKIDRRTFLGCSALTLGAACLGCGGMAYWAAAPPQAEYLEGSISGADGMDKKVLVAYASKCGSTGEIAQAIAEELAARGRGAELMLAENVRDVSGYSAVVLGSAVRFGRWLSPAADFAARFEQALREKPVAVFSAHIMALGDGEMDRSIREDYLPSAIKQIAPVSTEFFAGKFDPQKLSFLEGTLGRLIGANKGDLRDWTKIRAWAAELNI